MTWTRPPRSRCLAVLIVLFALAPPATAQPRGTHEPYVVPAGRSPLPQPGETFERPIPPTYLVEFSPIAPHHAGEGFEGQAPGPPPAVPWDEAADYVGQVVAAEGTIVSANNIGNLTFLNFHEQWQGKFYVVIFKEAYPTITGPPEEAYLGKTVRVTGRVDLHRGRPQIKVFDAEQIEVVE